ncbi:Intramembrane protease RasP/YluC, implicated in cell division based on FtsL cleavage [hydrothermal vent metagenome]|uniref:Intramembrane protease RasP/YluC, implicated in cell division based on FtsL cleavage n=1 Tax=hydrothermal vent metagenome TaxID=652676 RepID=A0A3B0RQ03_9ZZZZ
MSVLIFWLGSVLSFLFVFTIIVFVHEMGHFLAARFLGFKVDAFSIGFGKPLLNWTDKKGTEWRISALPLGGFVKFAGDAGVASVPDTEKLDEIKKELSPSADKKNDATSGIFHFMPVWRRAVVAAAGPCMNFIFAIFIFASFLTIFGSQYRNTVVDHVTVGSPAELAGFQAGDLITSVNGEEIESFQRLANMVSISANDPIQFIVKRNGFDLAITATPESVTEADPFGRMAKKGKLGIAPTQEILRKKFNPLEALVEGSLMTKTAITDQITFVGRLFRGKGSAEMLGGPMRIFYYAGKVGSKNTDVAAKDQRTLGQRVIALILLAGSLSVAIGLINLAPVPMLDGGHLLFYAYEAVVGRPLNEQVQIIGYKVGFSAVILLLAFATFNDLRYFSVFDFFGRLFS